MTPEMQMLWDSLEGIAGDVFFFFFSFLLIAGFLSMLLFAGLAIRAVWCWLTRASWSDVIVAVERKAFRHR
jgi:hypothetical protein